MNIFKIADGGTSLVKPLTNAIYKKYMGVSNESVRPLPTYLPDQNIKIKVHSATDDLLRHADKVNLQGYLKVIYTKIDLSPIDRQSQTGGDRLIFNGREWLVVQILEDWEVWRKVLIRAQVK